jgi:propionate CoA-transferase
MRDTFLKLDAVLRLVKWKYTAGNFNLDYRPDVPNPKFKSAREAALLVPDNACVMGTGMTGTMRPGILYRAIRDRFERTGHPCNLTALTAGGAGGRGVAPGTIEELGLKGWRRALSAATLRRRARCSILPMRMNACSACSRRGR